LTSWLYNIFGYSRAPKGEFGSNSCKSTKFDTKIQNGVTFNFFSGSQKFDHWGAIFQKKSYLNFFWYCSKVAKDFYFRSSCV